MRRTIKATTIMDTAKVKMTQDALYKYLTDHDVKISRIAELVGLAPHCVISYFRHNNNSNGNPRYFSTENIHKLNEALPKLAMQLRYSLITFGSDKMYTNRHGRVYDPGMIEPLNELGELMNLTGLTGRLLGWSKFKKMSVFSSPTNKAYGNISESDIMAINTEIVSVAGVLENVEIVPDDNAYDGSSSSKA